MVCVAKIWLNPAGSEPVATQRNMDVKKALQQYFGFQDFRGDQGEVIKHTLLGGHSLVLMPTGMGKSVCYQLPAKLLPGLTLVISPLIALMKDQVDKAAQRGFRVAQINSSLSKSERESNYLKLKQQAFELIYVTPERFRKPEFIEALKGNTISLLAVDEAHCISQWGHDFRPDYSRLSEIRKLLGNPTTMALTATATREVREDIVRQLGLAIDQVKLFNHGIERPNLALRVEEVYGVDEKIRAIVALRHQIKGPIIVYVSLISTLQKISKELQRLGLFHFDYHGQLPEKLRKRNQERFIQSSDALMIATPAFGLGVDKADIRAVIHAEVPGSLEAYYQEVGRAGRDGARAEAILLYDADDLTIQMDFIKWANPDPGFYERLYNLLAKNPLRVRSEGLDYLRAELNYYNSRDFRLETALNMLERWGAIEMDDQMRNINVVSALPVETQGEPAHKLRFEKAQLRLARMAEWVQSSNCRAIEIHKYFDVEGTKPCGICDRCQT